MFLGCDPKQLRRFAAQLASMSAGLDGARDALAHGIAAVEWDGEDAERFRSDAASGLLPGFSGLAESLRHAASSVSEEAAQQDAASASEPAGAVGGSVGASIRTMAPGDSRAQAVAASTGSGAHAAAHGAAPPRGLLAGIPGIGWGAADPGPDSDVFGPIPTGPSDGMLRDALGETSGPRAEQAWLDATDLGAAASAKAGPVPAVAAIMVDAVNGQMAQYEMLNGVRDGDATAIADGLVTAHLTGNDTMFNALELTPIAPVGVIGSRVSGPLLERWNALRREAIADEAAGGASQGSPVRYLMQAPVRYNEETIQPWADAHPGAVGDAVGDIGDGAARAEREVEQAQDETVAWVRDQIYRVPGAEEALALPRQMADVPRRYIPGLRDE